MVNIIGFSGLHHGVPFKRRLWPNLTPREYRIAQGFDSAAALVSTGKIRAAAAEERFSRQKATGSFPVEAIRYCLAEGALAPSDIDYIAHNFDYGRREVRAQFRIRNAFSAPDTLASDEFEEVYSPEAQIRLLDEHFPGIVWNEKFVPVAHHLAHAASTFFPSGFDEALILVSDGMGELESTTVAVGSGHEIKLLKQVRAPHSLGILYGVFTLYLGFYMNLDEYKVMGLAPYGNPRRYVDRMMDLVSLQPDGTYVIPVLAQNRTRAEQETHGRTLGVLAEMFGPPREENAELTQRHMDLAAALQAVLQTSLLHVLKYAADETGQNQLCMAGGVALNCTANSVIHKTRLFDRMFVQPAAGDDGTALGAALYVRHLREPETNHERMTVPLWGPRYDSDEIGQVVQSRPDCEVTHFDCFDNLAANAVERLAGGQILAWFQGRMEFGPRALGSRSILATPRDPHMRDRINRLVKQREEFRPFAPAVTAEAATHYFELEPGHEAMYAHMLFVTQVRPQYRSLLPAVTHVDGSARVQTVARADNYRFWRLLKEFERVADVPILVNTYFNVRGQPIVRTPDEAVDTFIAAGLDGLVIGDYLVVRKQSGAAKEQPE
jgi:carbamoyltransferase